MRLLVIGAGMMGSAAAYDMARSALVEAVTLADLDKRRARVVAAVVNKLTGGKKVSAVAADACGGRRLARLMSRYDAALSCVPYFYNYRLAEAAMEAGCHFADLGGNNSVVRQQLGLDKQAAKRGVRIAPDCGLSPGMASILAGELLRGIGGQADALKIYVGGLPRQPRPPFAYQLVFSVEGLINEYSEPARILRNKKLTTVEPLTEVERFQLPGLPELEAFHTSGGASTLPETFAGQVGECFEKTLRYPGHAAMIRSLYDFGLFSSAPRQVGKAQIRPRDLMASLMLEKFSPSPARGWLRFGHRVHRLRLSGTPLRTEAPDVTILRVEAVRRERVDSFTMVDESDSKTGITSMMRTTAWPASIVTQMLASGEIGKSGVVLQERDVPAQQFLTQMASRGITIVRHSTAPEFEEPGRSRRRR
jgi:lysine 6-dehydrogenase